MDFMGNRGVGITARTLHLLRWQLSNRPTHRVHVRTRADRRRRAETVGGGRQGGDNLNGAIRRLGGRAVGILCLAGPTAYRPNRLAAQGSVHLVVAPRCSTPLAKALVVI